MKKKDILNLYASLSSVDNLKGVKFSYAIARNLAKLKPEVEAIQQASKPTDEYATYEAERAKLAQKHAEKDEHGNPVIVGNQYQIADQPTFEKELEKLNKTHKETIEARKKQLEEIEKLLEEDTPVELYKIKLEHIPEEITTQQMVSVFPIIEE